MIEVFKSSFKVKKILKFFGLLMILLNINNSERKLD